MVPRFFCGVKFRFGTSGDKDQIMKNQFSDFMASRTDSQLAEVLRLKDDYQPEAVEAAMQEINARKNRISIEIRQVDVNNKKIRIPAKNNSLFSELSEQSAEGTPILIEYNHVVYKNIIKANRNGKSGLKSYSIELSKELSDILNLKAGDTVELNPQNDTYVLKKIPAPVVVKNSPSRTGKKTSDSSFQYWKVVLFTLCSFALICWIALSYEGEQPEVSILGKYDGYIINSETMDKYKKSINIRLQHKLTSGQLTEIANYLRRKNKEYDYLFILYYLPGMVVGNGAYATTHFTPGLSVDMVGSDEFERETEKANKRQVVESGEVVGKWEDNSLGHRIIIQIYKRKNQYIMRHIEGGEYYERKLKYTRFRGLKRFVYDNNFGEYLLIDKNGNLNFYDEQGFIYSLSKIKW